LSVFVPGIAERQNGMIIGLSKSRPVSRKSLLAFFVRFKNSTVGFGILSGKPGQERRSKIKADSGIVIYDSINEAIFVKDPGDAVWLIAFRCDSLVPIMVGMGGFLKLYRFNPWILARWLIKVSVNADIVFHREFPADLVLSMGRFSK
jgi:hypothetical protein